MLAKPAPTPDTIVVRRPALRQRWPGGCRMRKVAAPGRWAPNGFPSLAIPITTESHHEKDACRDTDGRRGRRLRRMRQIRTPARRRSHSHAHASYRPRCARRSPRGPWNDVWCPWRTWNGSPRPARCSKGRGPKGQGTRGQEARGPERRPLRQRKAGRERQDHPHRRAGEGDP